MLGTHYYHGLIRKFIIGFGSIFNNLTLIRYDNELTTEIERITVPISYAPKDKYMKILWDGVNSTDERKVAVTFPIMAFEITGMQYDPSRQIQPLLRAPKPKTSTSVDASYVGVPYSLNFSLYIFSRYQRDADQILEQILPIFVPGYTFKAMPIPALGFHEDYPIQLNSIDRNIEYEGDYSVKGCMYTLNFTMNVRFYGPVQETKIIRRVFANTFYDPSLAAGYIVRVNLTNGNNGVYKIDDTVYTGNSITDANAAGIVLKYSSNNNYLMIGGAQGQFKQGEIVKALSTNAAYQIASFDATPLKVQSIQIDPNPITANANSDYGYTETLTEFPNL